MSNTEFEPLNETNLVRFLKLLHGTEVTMGGLGGTYVGVMVGDSASGPSKY